MSTAPLKHITEPLSHDDRRFDEVAERLIQDMSHHSDAVARIVQLRTAFIQAGRPAPRPARRRPAP